MATPSQARSDVVALEEGHRKPESLLHTTLRRFTHDRAAVVGALLLLVIVLYVTVGSAFITESYSNKTDIMHKNQPPSADHIFGTDSVGRDVFARTIYGGQISLAIGLTSVTIAVTLGTVVGLIAGYFGGIVDAVLMRLVEAMLTIPLLVLLLLLSRALTDMSASTINILGREISVTVVVIVIIIGLTGWMGLARIVRSMTLSLKEQEFVVAAKGMGAGNMRIIFGHILPNCMAPIVVAATLGVGEAIVVEAALSFLGFGVLPPTASWGNILNGARQSIDDLWWLWVAPGTLITLTVLAINFLGDGLRDAIDPFSRK